MTTNELIIKDSNIPKDPFTKYVYIKENNEIRCLHLQCPHCNGTGINFMGGACIHNLVCKCPKCSIR